jgi:hypothetical protein
LSASFKSTVEAGYDRIADEYLASKDPEAPATIAALEALARRRRVMALGPRPKRRMTTCPPR